MPTLFLLYSNNNEDAGVAAFVALLLIFGPMLIFGAQYIYNSRYDHIWERGLFPQRLRYSRDNLLEAYICLAARMIQSDTIDAGEKIIYMNKYFAKHFPNSHYNFSESLTYSYSHPIQLPSVTRWLRIKLPHRSQKVQVMYFLAGLSMVDGELRAKEIRILERVNELLELTPKEFKSIIGMYQKYQETAEEQQNNFRSPNKRKSAIKIACEILGVSEHASLDEVKKAYRSLVKVHHPDKFSTESQEQQRIAKDKFMVIQKAYELLEKFK